MNILSNYFKLNPETYQNFILWKSTMTIISSYQCFDIVLTIAQALNYEIEGQKLVFIYRIMIQVFLIIAFHIAMSKLKKETALLINIITLLKYFSLIILWCETNYDLIYTNEYDQRSYAFEMYGIMILFLIAIESQLCKSLIILFSLFYTLFRFPSFTDNLEIIGSTRVIFGHLMIQSLLIYNLYQTQNSNETVLYRNFSPQNTQRALYTNTQREMTEPQNKRNHIQNITNEDLENLNNLKQLEQQYEFLLVNFQCGIYIFENAQQPIRIINSFMSHIVLNEDQLNPQLTQLELYDFGFLSEESCTILPSFHRSKDISNFIKFTQTLEYQYINNGQSEEKKEIQFFCRKMQMQTLIEHLLAFSHIKYNLTNFALDFSLKIYMKKDKLYTQVILNPVIISSKPQILIYISDLTEEPFILQLQQYLKNSDDIIQTISQKIKEPLNCTLSMLELVQKEVNQDLQTQYIDPALAGCKLLISTANDFQDYVTMHKKNKLDRNLMDIHTREFISDCLNIIKAQALFRGLNIQVHIKQNVPMFLRTDPNRVRQVVLSLLIKSIQVTVNGSIEISSQKSPLLTDHIEIIIKVMATNVNEGILESVEQTIKHLKQQTLVSKQMTDIVATSKQYSFSILTAFYISLAVAIMPFEFNSIKTEEGTQFYFILLIKNENPNFNKQLTQKRQSALVANKSQFHQVYGQSDQFKRHQSQRLTEISRIQVQEKLKKMKRESQEETISGKVDPQIPQFGQSELSYNQQQPGKSYSVSQISEQEDSQQSSSSSDSKAEMNNPDGDVESSKSSFQLDDKVGKKELKQQPSQFLDTIICVKEPKARKISVSFIQSRLHPQISQQLTSKQRDSLLTFGGRSSVYSSMRISSVNLGPNELLDCFEKMERIKQQQFVYKCQCPKILICEQNDFDLYAISHQLSNLKIPYIYTMQRMHIVDQLRKQFSQYKTCCKGYHIVFVGVEYVNEQFSQDCAKIKAVLSEYQKDTRLIGLIGFQDDESKIALKKLPFHDCLQKPIMIDALLFILAKWVKL
ncbi:unnamed protein product [Paramecium octaurelia]|uniref:Uncharacterized protein n=1 Tax=Paramecium octaurelia TaxID=43137 RepID=A0A8S1VEI3_PAROT|nr:unnamed protein product [Paramecium octaurelia]